MATEACLSISGLTHVFDGRVAVSDVSLELGAGELLCLLGPSGCGKTTTLRLVAGLEVLQVGTIAIHGETVAGATLHLPPERRGVGLVFQDFALFPHLTVGENVAFGLRQKGGVDRRRRSLFLLDHVGLAHRLDDYPHMLSGGEQQRVALARALAPGPRLMLMDEPFSGLDVRLRDQVRATTLDLLRLDQAATLMVTHDPEEAMRVADRIAVMRDGRIVQIGPTAQLYDHPADVFVARFFGETNQFSATASGGRVSTPWGDLPSPAGAGDAVDIVVRPEGLRLMRNGAGAAARVLERRDVGPSRLLRLTIDGLGHPWLARVGRDEDVSAGAEVHVALDPAHVFVFATDPASLRG